MATTKNKIAMRVEGAPLWDSAKLIPYEANAKRHDEAHVDFLAKSIRDNGFYGTILIEPDGTIIAGHGRTLALKKLGVKKIPVTIVTDKTPDEIKQIRLRDNFSSGTDYDYEQLGKEYAHFKSIGLNFDDMADIGFTHEQIESFDMLNMDSILESIESEIYTIDESEKIRQSDDADTSPYKHARVVDSNGYNEKYAVIVVCKSEEDQKQIYELADQLGLTCKLQTTA